MQINQVGECRFEDVLSQTSPELAEVAGAARALFVDVLPGVTEVAWLKQKAVGYGVGPKKMSEQFCYLGFFKKHINLGFYYGADLDDPKKLLEGTGKALRHIKLTSVADLQRPGVRELIEKASKHLPKLSG